MLTDAKPKFHLEGCLRIELPIKISILIRNFFNISWLFGILYLWIWNEYAFAQVAC